LKLEQIGKDKKTNPTVLTLSLGANRIFKLEGTKDFKGNNLKIETKHGNVLVMGKDSQFNYLHGIEQSTGQEGTRYSITLRHTPDVNTTAKQGSTTGISKDQFMSSKNIISTNNTETKQTSTGKTVKVISDADIDAYNTYLSKSGGKQAKEFFTNATTFKEFFNPATGKREKAPQSSKWLLQDNGLYNLVDKEGGEVYITNVDLKTGLKVIEKSTQAKTTTEDQISEWIKNEVPWGVTTPISQLAEMYNKEKLSGESLEEFLKRLSCLGKLI